MSSQSSRIRQRRLQLGMSQEDLAFKIGTSQKQISRYENDSIDFTGKVLYRLTEALETTSDYILGITDNPDREVTEDNLDALETEIIQLLRSQPEFERKRALLIFKAMLIPDAS